MGTSWVTVRHWGGMTQAGTDQLSFNDKGQYSLGGLERQGQP